MRAPLAVVVARGALVVAALSCAVWLNQGHYAIGLDFQGGARVVLIPKGDPQRLMLHALAARPDATVTLVGSHVEVAIDDGNENDLRDVIARVGAEADHEAYDVVTTAWPPWFGRKLAAGVAIAAALLWLGVLVRAHTPGLAIAGTFALAWTITLVDQLALGGTLSVPMQLSGILLGLAAAPAARAGTGEPLARIRAAWPAAIALGVVLVASLVALQLAPDHGMLRIVHALRFTRHPLFAVAPIAAACAIAATRPAR